MTIPLSRYLLAIAGLGTLVAAPATTRALHAGGQTPTTPAPVHARFDLSDPDAGPFPTDVFTVDDSTQMTGRRVSLPYPDCTIYPSDCADLDVINTLDGFGLQPRLSIPFDGPIDPATVTSAAVLVVALKGTTDDPRWEVGETSGVNQVVWDALTNTLHVESDALLAQHTRYALLVTNALRDTAGRAVQASEEFRRFRHTVRGDYKHALLEAVHAARSRGVREEDLVAVSVYTTQSITPVMERIRDEIKATTPPPADFHIGPGGERAVFSRTDVTSVRWRQHTGVNPPALSDPVALDMASLDVVAGAVGTMAYGRFLSPSYRIAGDYMPAVGTRSGTPIAQGVEDISFTLFLPSAIAPVAGWPVAIVGAPTVRHPPLAAVAAILASHGIATIGIHAAGCGFGPLGTLTIATRDGRTLTIPDRGRSYDQNGDNSIGITEGSIAAPPRAWTVGERDSYRQTAIDLLQMVRIIEVGLDVDDDGFGDLDAKRIFHLGFSAGSNYGTMFLALEPSVSVAVESVTAGMLPEHGRWSPVRRPLLGTALATRIPSLINGLGISAIEGVPVNPPRFDENKPLRDLPAVTNIVPGATQIQRAFELMEWGQQSGQSPIVWAPYIRKTPLSGIAPKSVIFQFARGDQQANNPGTAALLRAGDLADRTLHYRHDLAFAESPLIPKNPHMVLILPTHANATFRAVSRGLQTQIAEFFASGGTVVAHPEPARFFEVPLVGPPSEELHYIP